METKKRKGPKRTIANHCTTGTFRRTIEYAIELARSKGIVLADWHPHQLRHSRGTEVRKRFGLEAAQVYLGHSKANVTEIYAERDMERAREVAALIG